MDEAKKHSGKTHQPATDKSKKYMASSKTAMLQEIEQLKNQLAELEKEAADNLNGWQRERADFANYKKRIERDHAQFKQDITGAIIKKYLVVLDDLELAMKDKPNGGHGEAWATGIELIARKLLSIIEAEGVERIWQNRVPFDHTIHEAISSEKNTDFESGDVIEVTRQGYKLGDRVLRPAMVRVAK